MSKPSVANSASYHEMQFNVRFLETLINTQVQIMASLGLL